MQALLTFKARCFGEPISQAEVLKVGTQDGDPKPLVAQGESWSCQFLPSCVPEPGVGLMVAVSQPSYPLPSELFLSLPSVWESLRFKILFTGNCFICSYRFWYVPYVDVSSRSSHVTILNKNQVVFCLS